jgi:hypothetical protein
LANIRAAAKKAQAENSDGAESHSTGNGLRCTIKAFAAISTPNLCYLDSGASHHMFADKSLFKDYQSKISHVELADGNTIEVQGKGFVNVRAENNTIIPMKALHVPGINATLISLGRLYERGCEIKRTGKSSFVLVREGEVVFKASIVGGTCMVRVVTTHEGQSSISAARLSTITDVELLHRRAGHCSNDALSRMFGIKAPKIKCDACSLSKSHRLVFPSHLPEATHPLELVHMDLSGKITPASCGGGYYYFKITDWFTQYCHVFILSSKSETFSKFVEYYNNVTTNKISSL